MNRKVLDFLRGQEMLSPGDHLVCAVSGGKDSMAMLHLMCSLRETLNISVSAAHFNHQLRGEESLRDENFVREYCAKNKIPFTSGAGDVSGFAKGHHLSVEDAARTLRYRYFEENFPESKIATAHTAEDNLETMLLHLIRGCGLHGLSGIPPKRGNIIRPLLPVSRREIEHYLTANEIPHAEDSSNAEDRYLRNRIRHHVLPLLMAENPSLPENISQLCLTLLQEDAYLQQQAELALQRVIHAQHLSVSEYLQLPEALKNRVMRLYLQETPELSSLHIRDAIALCQNSTPSASLNLPGGWILKREYDVLKRTRLSGNPILPEACTISPGETVSFGSWRISCELGHTPKNREDTSLAISAESVSPPFSVRAKQPGDILKLPSGSKKLSRYLIDQKIPADQRDYLPVILSGEELVAVLPLTVSLPHRPQAGGISYFFTVTRTEDNHES